MFGKIGKISIISILCCIIIGSMTVVESADTPASKPDFKKLSDISQGYRKVISTADGSRSLYTIYVRDKDGQMLGVLPSNYASTRYFFAMTISSGETYAGLQAGDMYVYWKRYDKRLALVVPNISIRSYGDAESKDSVERLFTDKVLLDVPIVAMDGGSPVIDLDDLLVGMASKFFGSSAAGANKSLCKVTQAKAFPKNVELAFEVPVSGGQLKTLHYSISSIPNNTGYKPRKADDRIGYFTTMYQDYGKFKGEESKIRYINRWRLEKADSSLGLSPPKKPIVFYIEHTTPVRYRRWVREGILYWNKAFENVGIASAIEVYYQDSRSGAHMDKDPEDVRYNFIRWLSNNQGTAIGPSRVHPMTGQILDADVILTDGWIRHFWKQWHEVMPEIMMEGFSAETYAWLAKHPEWDPRVNFADASERECVTAELALQASGAYSGYPLLSADAKLIGDDKYDGLSGRTSQVNGSCELSDLMAFDVALFRMHEMVCEGDDPCEVDANSVEESDVEVADDDKGDIIDELDGGEGSKEKSESKSVKKKAAKDKEPMIDGIPERFIGPMVAELVCHEVGHTLGLRHNFKASSIYDFNEINSDKIKGKKPFASSVMDYIGANINFTDGQIQGDYTLIGVGPYDMWAIEYGYTASDKSLPKILDRVAEPELVYGTDEDQSGPDPLARAYDFGKDPLDYAENQMRIVRYHRERLLEKYVSDGDSWGKAREGYEMGLGLQGRAVSMMANWVGGAFVYRDHKGDKNAHVPIEPVDADTQRAALNFVIDNVFYDEVYGLDANMLRHLSLERWWDDVSTILGEPTWPVHDRIMGVQNSTLTMLMNPTVLRRVYDNEFLVDVDEDALTIPELLGKLTGSIFTELGGKVESGFTNRKPMISSLRRNLQRQYVQRLISLSAVSGGLTINKPISNIALLELRRIQRDVKKVLDKYGRGLDAYSRGHLQELGERIEKTLDSQYMQSI